MGLGTVRQIKQNQALYVTKFNSKFSKYAFIFNLKFTCVRMICFASVLIIMEKSSLIFTSEKMFNKLLRKTDFEFANRF